MGISNGCPTKSVLAVFQIFWPIGAESPLYLEVKVKFATKISKFQDVRFGKFQGRIYFTFLTRKFILLDDNYDEQLITYFKCFDFSMIKGSKSSNKTCPYIKIRPEIRLSENFPHFWPPWYYKFQARATDLVRQRENIINHKLLIVIIYIKLLC